MMVRRAVRPQVRRGTSRAAMEYVSLGNGPKSLLFMQGGPGSEVPGSPVELGMAMLLFRPYIAAGYTVFTVTRRRQMPEGYAVADMAEDYIGFIDERLGGRADLVVAESYGGMIAQYLAGIRPHCLRHLALVATGARLSSWSDAVDIRLIAALERGDTHGAAVIFGEYLLPEQSSRLLRELFAPVLARRMVPADDVLIETRADLSYDARPFLPSIRVPVLLICGDQDRFFPPDIVQETAALIADCTLVWKKGKGHVPTVAGRHVPREVLAFVSSG